MTTRTVLILGGTGEAIEIARYAHARPGLRVISSLAGRTAKPAEIPGELRRGGFGGIEPMRAYMVRSGIDLVIDASHPFATQISAHAAEVCGGLNIDLLRFCRPAWRRQRGDRWICVDDLAQAAQQASTLGNRILLACGRKDIAAFTALDEHYFVVRLIDAPLSELPLARYHLILARGPFAESDELALLREFQIDLLVSKNSGGASSYAKIAAARALQIPVIMVRRPRPRSGSAASEDVSSLDQVYTWIDVAHGQV